MSTRFFAPCLLAAAALAVGGCATTPSGESPETAAAASESKATSESRRDAPRETATATETAAAERRVSTGTGSSADMAKLVDQLNEAARELATLRTANAKLRADKDRPRPASTTEAVAKADPADERLAASLKSFAAFKQEMAALLAELERAKKSGSGADAELKAAAEQTRQTKAALARIEEDLRVEKRLRLEAEANAGQLREQLRTIARAMADAGLSAEKLGANPETGSTRGRCGAPGRRT